MHVQHIRTVKDRVRCMYNSVPFKMMPSHMIVEMVTSATFWLNMFPPTDGISKVISPRGIILGLTVDYNNEQCKLEFGSYANMTTRCKHVLLVRSVCDLPVMNKGATTS
jgi:hypothetical protein